MGSANERQVSVVDSFVGTVCTFIQDIRGDVHGVVEPWSDAVTFESRLRGEIRLCKERYQWLMNALR